MNRYDLVLIQEIRDSRENEPAVKELQDLVNKFVTAILHFHFVIFFFFLIFNFLNLFIYLLYFLLFFFLKKKKFYFFFLILSISIIF